MVPQLPQPGRRTCRTIAVIEDEPYLVPELQRQFAGEQVAVHSHRTPADIESASRPDLIVLHFRGVDGGLARLLGTPWMRQSGVMSVLVVPASALDLEWTLRDLGADAILEETCGGTRLANVCRRILTPQPRQQSF